MRNKRVAAFGLLLLALSPILSACSVAEEGGVGLLRTVNGIRIVVIACSSPAEEVVISYSSSSTNGILDRLTVENARLAVSMELPPDWEQGLESDAQYRIGALGGGVPTAVSQFTKAQLAELREGEVLAADWGNHKQTATFTADGFADSIASAGCD